jgi:hypothetical protein
MSNIKTPRSMYSNLERYDFMYVSPTQQPGCSPPVNQDTKECYRENLGSFSLSAAIRFPHNCCRGGNCSCGNLAGVT